MTRQAFEAQIKKQFPTASDDLLLGRSSTGRYGSMVVEHAWQTWQAATSYALERAAEVCDAIAHDWRGANSQSLQCADAIRALKDADTC